MLKKMEDMEWWFMMDLDFRWEGEVKCKDVFNVILLLYVVGGYVFDSNYIMYFFL